MDNYEELTKEELIEIIERDKEELGRRYDTIKLLDKALDKACEEKAKKEYIDDEYATEHQINNRAKEIKDYLLEESEKE